MRKSFVKTLSFYVGVKYNMYIREIQGEWRAWQNR